MKAQLVIFDLDGTLFDTAPLNYLAYKDALAAEGFDLDRDYFFTHCNGNYYRDFIPKITGSDEEGLLQRIHRSKKAAYGRHIAQARPNHQLIRLARLARDSSHLALVTTASRENTMELLAAFGMTDFFDLTLTQEDVTRKKPDPQGFLMAMERFGADAAHTVIFEDSPSGIQAAKATGAAVFSVLQFPETE